MKARLTYGNSRVELGILESYSENFQKSVTTVPITSKGSEDTFAVETGSGREIQMSCSRVNPPSPDDSGDASEWSNAKWYRYMQDVVDRWQSRTDGASLDVIPDPDNPYIPHREGMNGYISRLSLSYKMGDNTRISSQIEFATGRMYINNDRPNPIKGESGKTKDKTKFTVLMSSPAEGTTQWFTIHSDKDQVECITSYALTGGMECPFEILEMKVPKRALELYAPGLVDNIIAGKSRIYLDAVGTGMFTITKCKLSGKTYNITAYADPYGLSGHVLETSMSLDPFAWIKYILGEAEFGVSYTGELFKYAYVPKTGNAHVLSFTKGTNIWYILQVCAWYLGCRLFFSDDTAYLVDCRAESSDALTSSSTNPLSDYGAIDLYPTDRDSPYFNKTLGNPTLGSEGWDTIVNTVAITCRTSADKSATDTFTFDNPESVQVFQEYSYQAKIPSLIESPDAGFTQADTLAQSIMDYRKEPQQSVTFTFKEMKKSSDGIVWESTFPPVARVPIVFSVPDGFVISNRSMLYEDLQVPQKLMLSTYTRNFPEGTTTYTFGQVAKVDLASSTSNLSSTVKN